MGSESRKEKNQKRNVKSPKLRISGKGREVTGRRSAAEIAGRGCEEIGETRNKKKKKRERRREEEEKKKRG